MKTISGYCNCWLCSGFTTADKAKYKIENNGKQVKISLTDIKGGMIVECELPTSKLRKLLETKK